MEILKFGSKYRYRASRNGIEIPITLKVGIDQQVSLLAKVDTGAASCIFAREYADQLGIEIHRGLEKKFVTANGFFWTYEHSVTLSCFEYEFDTIVYFTRNYEFPRNVLGLQGCLDKLRFGLVHHDESLFLSHYDD